MRRGRHYRVRAAGCRRYCQLPASALRRRAARAARWTSATGCHCQERPTCVWDTRLIDLMVTSVFGNQRPSAPMIGAAGSSEWL